MEDKPKYKYVPLYTQAEQEADERVFEQNTKNGKVDWSNFSRLMMRDICTNTEILKTDYIGGVKIESAIKALKNPKVHWRILLAVSRELMHCSPHYYRLNMLFANMSLFLWGIDVCDVKSNASIDNLKKTYLNLIGKFETMDIKHEFGKIMKILPYQDLYCGLIVDSSSDFFIQEISLKLVKLYQVQDGLFNFKINLSGIDPVKINAYPDYVQKAYLDFIDGKAERWYLPPADKQICIKLNCQWTYPFPLLIGLVKDILDLETYKKLKLQSARTDNYKAIMVKVPIDTSTVDKPLVTPETLSIFTQLNREALSDDIGYIHTLGSDGEAISFKDSSNTRNNVSDAVDALYDASGQTKELYNGSSSATAVTYSIENDSGFVYSLYRQFERWCNRFIKIRKYNKTGFKFHFYLLDATAFNRDGVAKRYKEACTLGAPVVDKWLAALDMTPSRVLGSYVLQNEVFKFSDNFVPLTSTYNSSADAGRPSNSDKGEILSDEGEKSADAEKHDL